MQMTYRVIVNICKMTGLEVSRTVNIICQYTGIIVKGRGKEKEEAYCDSSVY